MGTKTGIEWTDATWNPIIGCSRVSEGCRNCYAEAIAGRFGQGKQTVYSGLTQIVHPPQQHGPVAGDPGKKRRAVWTGQIAETRQSLQPLSWRQPKRIFVNSMSDLFHENVTDEQRDRIFAVMALCPQHTFQVLTKRPERMRDYIVRREESGMAWRRRAVWMAMGSIEAGLGMPEPAWPLANVWLGVSVENQAAADERIPLLLETPAAVRFLSCEPLLGALDIRRYLGLECIHEDSYSESDTNATVCRECEEMALVDWVICGGESGPNARPMNPVWALDLRDQCQAAGSPFFFKQWGEWAPFGKVDRTVPTWSFPPHVWKLGKKIAGSELDGREWKEFPSVGH